MVKYGIVGTGALGGFYGGMLAHSGKDVHFLLHSDYEEVTKNGLKIDSVNGDFVLQNVNAWKSPEDMPACDVVLVCLKTTNNHLLKSLLPPLLHKDSLVVMIQNGLGIEEELGEIFPEINIAGGLAFICSQKKGPGHILHLDFGKLNLGNYRNNKPELLMQVCRDFSEAGISCHIADDLYTARWQKLVWNIPFNGMTVVLDATTDQMMKLTATKELALEMMLEVIGGANHCGVKLDEGYARKMIDMTVAMTPYAPSMKLDYDFRRPMEIGAIYSRPVREAAKAGFDMKKVAMLEKQLLFIQDRMLGQH